VILDEILQTTYKRAAQIGDLPGIDPSYRHKSLRDAILSVHDRNAVIAELKYASPSNGSPGIVGEPEMIAQAMIAGGCTALSVLTEPDFFLGSVENLKKVKKSSSVPVLRKDFIIDIRQVYETRALGADAVLLIAKILGDRLSSFVDLSLELGLEPLVEVHTPEEAECALASGADLIGINNRDLGTMETDLDTTRRLFPLLQGRGRLVVSMSGIRTAGDIRYLSGNCDAFLIGSAIMRSKNPQKCLEGFVFA
jgi:indole-3-glycerol phosphate synthase